MPANEGTKYLWETKRPDYGGDPWRFKKAAAAEEGRKEAAERVSAVGTAPPGSEERGPAVKGQEEGIPTFTPGPVAKGKAAPKKDESGLPPYKREGWDPYGKESAGAFTNIPGQVGKQVKGAAEGVTWFGLPEKKEGERRYAVGYEDDPRLGMNEEDEWTFDKMKQLYPEMFDALTSPKYDVGEIGADGARKAVPKTARQQLPAFDRDVFEKNVLGQLGENPFMINPRAEMRAKWAELPSLFNHVFDGQIRWEDRGKLTKEERAHWEMVKKQFDANNYNDALSRKQTLMDQYKWMMGNFDERKKTMDALRKEYKENRAAEGKPPERIRARDANGVQTWWMWDKETRTFKNSGLIATSGEGEGEKMPPKVSAAYKIINMFKPKVDQNAVMMGSMLLATADPNTDEGKRKIEQAQAMMTPQFSGTEMDRMAYEAAVRIFYAWVLGDYLTGANPQGEGKPRAATKTKKVTPEEMGKGKGTAKEEGTPTK